MAQSGQAGTCSGPHETWPRYCANDVTGGPVNSGHYLAEEAPQEVLERFGAFFG